MNEQAILSRIGKLPRIYFLLGGNNRQKYFLQNTTGRWEELGKAELTKRLKALGVSAKRNGEPSELDWVLHEIQGNNRIQRVVCIPRDLQGHPKELFERNSEQVLNIGHCDQNPYDDGRSPQDVRLCREWLEKVISDKGKREWMYSYGLKHSVEKSGGTYRGYVSEETLIAVAETYGVESRPDCSGRLFHLPKRAAEKASLPLYKEGGKI